MVQHACQCIACSSSIPAGAAAEAAKVGGEWSFLCLACWSKCIRGGREPRQVIEAVLLSFDPNFGGPECECDHEDYRDLELLGLWPDAD